MLTLRARSFARATFDTRILRLHLDGARFRYRAGQAALLGLHGRSVRKPYSIASAPEEAAARGYLEFLIKTADGHGAHLAGLRRGALVDVVGPLGSFCFPRAPRERSVLFVAGGAGIAPLRAMLQHALLAAYRRHLAVVYSARTPRGFAYGPELRRLALQGRIDLVLTVTRHAPRGWRGRRGRIALPLLASVVTEPATLCFVSGPPGLVAGATALLRRLGVAARRIRTERRKA